MLAKKILAVLFLEPDKQVYWREHVSTVKKGYVYLGGVWNVFTAMLLLWQAIYNPALWVEVLVYAAMGVGILVMKSRLCALASVVIYGYSAVQYLVLYQVQHTWQLLMTLLFVIVTWVLLRFYQKYYEFLEESRKAAEQENQDGAEA